MLLFLAQAKIPFGTEILDRSEGGRKGELNKPTGAWAQVSPRHCRATLHEGKEQVQRPQRKEPSPLPSFPTGVLIHTLSYFLWNSIWLQNMEIEHLEALKSILFNMNISRSESLWTTWLWWPWTEQCQVDQISPPHTDVLISPAGAAI